MTKVLVAEDERLIRDLLVDTLYDCGYDVMEARDGREAFRIARMEHPDLILLDVMMPEMNGFEVLQRLRETPDTEAIPVIMLTAVPAASGELEAMKFGVKHYISKPFDPDVLESTVKVALRDATVVTDEPSRPTEVWGGSTSQRSTFVAPDSQQYIRLGDQLIDFERKLGGGLPVGSLTLAEGTSSTGKSVICQNICHAALMDGHRVAYFSSQHTARSLESQMKSIAIDPSEYLRSEKLFVYPVAEPITGQDSSPLMAALALDIERISNSFKLIVVDAISNLAGSSQEQSVMGFFSSCKRLCGKGKTIIVVTHSSGLNADLLNRVAGLCESHLNFRSSQIRNKVIREIQVLKVGDIKQDQVYINFEVEPDIGIKIIPVFKART